MSTRDVFWRTVEERDDAMQEADNLRERVGELEAEVVRLRSEVERHCSRADQANNRRRKHLADLRALRALVGDETPGTGEHA